MNPLRRFRALFRKEKLDAEMAEEMRAHLDAQTQRNLAAGMSAEEARHAARRSFGGEEQHKERARDQRGWMWLDQALGDFRFATRALRKAPGFTFAVVATLAVGIGLVTSIVNVARPILWPGLPFREADRLVVLRERSPKFTGYAGLVAVRFVEYARHATVFAAVGAEKLDVVNLVVAGEPYSVRVSSVTAGFFPTLGIACNQGRLFAPDEYESGQAGETVVLSHFAWTKFFGRDAAIIGQDVMLGNRLRRVIGVLAPGFKATPTSPDVDGIYLSFALPPGATTPVNAVARLKPGITVAQANADLRTIRPEMPGPPSEFYAQLEPAVMALPDALRENRAQPFRIFLGAAAALYLIGCTTVANLMLSRAVGRRREMGVRLALGSTPERIVRLVAAEALLLALLGAGAGTLLACWAQNFTAHLMPAGVVSSDLIAGGFPWQTLGIALALGIPTCVLTALVPARGAGRIGLAEALKEGAGAKGDSPRLRWLRGAFVVTQSALAVALLIGAGLMLRTVGRLQRIELGFNPEHKFVLSGIRTGPVDRNRAEALNTAIAEHVASLPGVAGAVRASAAPLAGSMAMMSFKIEGRADGGFIAANGYGVTPSYFEMMQMPILAGPGFAGLCPGDRPVVIVNEAVVREYFPHENPVGRILLVGNQRLEIVGVTRNVAAGYRGDSGVTLVGGKKLTAQLYTPIWQSRGPLPSALNVILHLQREPDAGFAAAVRRAVFSVDPTVVMRLTSLDEIVGEWSRTERQALVMLQVLAGLALGLAAFGTFSVMAYAVAQRRAELGLRLVLGASPAQLMAFVLKRGVTLGVVGIVIGVGVAAGMSRFVQAVLYQASPHDPVVFAGVALLVLAVNALACWFPARRAAKVDLMVALRAE